ncbi:MAG: molybdopterin-dependent oxidoreductase [Anaerolineales bacterium]|nr:molybdopterin-dependent oxidoreductase [Anaerolineales bacterium]
MQVEFTLNNKPVQLEVAPGEILMNTLRYRMGLYGVKFGDEDGESGASTVLLDGKPVNSALMLTAQAGGHSVETIEMLGENPEMGWKNSGGLHPIQQAFVDTGAIQSGYSTPGTILVAKALLDKTLNPTEEQIRDAFSGILDRETAYVKPIQAVFRAAAMLRGEEVEPIERPIRIDPDSFKGGGPDDAGQPEEMVGRPGGPALQTRINVMPKIQVAQDVHPGQAIGKPEPKLDGNKLAQGKPAFTADFEIRGMLIGKILHSPVAHANIRKIDASKARALPGVAAVLTWEDLPRIPFCSAGQTVPIPGPKDSFSLDNKVRHVGDRVAFVAAETEEIAQQALELIKVEYEELPVIIDPEDAMKKGAVVIHDEPDYVNFADSDPQRNLAAEIRIDIGDIEKGFKEAEKIIEGVYSVPKVHQGYIEPHVVITYWDEDDRLVIRTATQVPFHVRRMVAPLVGLPIKRIRVIKPRVGGAFGGKQDMALEDAAAHLTVATGRPVKIEFTRKEEFINARSRHPMKMWMKTGVRKDGTITANEMRLLSDTGAYGAHALTVAGNLGAKAMAIYVGDGTYREDPNIRFYADIVYTNTPQSGAYRGYGAPQGFFAVEEHMDKVAQAIGMDPVIFRLKNTLRAGEIHPFTKVWNEGGQAFPERVDSVGLQDCIREVAAVLEWKNKYNNPDWQNVPGKPYLRRGIGIAIGMQGSALSHIDMGSATLKINDDGSFNLLIGATDLGTGSDTVMAQIAAETLGISTSDIVVYSSDTDVTPFDKGAYASSTTYLSGGAVARAAEMAAISIRDRAARILNEAGNGTEVTGKDIQLADRKAWAPDGRTLTIEQIAINAIHNQDQEQIMGYASYNTKVSPPPFAATAAEVTIDTGTGQIVVDRLVMAADAGVVVNPLTAAGQVEGGILQSLGYALCEEMAYDEKGQPRETDFIGYHLMRSDEMPEIQSIFVETFEPSHPYGVKSVGEVVLNPTAPAIGNAVANAAGVHVDHLPITPEKLWQAMKA